jgi:hypothetical protein
MTNGIQLRLGKFSLEHFMRVKEAYFDHNSLRDSLLAKQALLIGS